jgi:hypothetical protein
MFVYHEQKGEKLFHMYKQMYLLYVQNVES